MEVWQAIILGITQGLTEFLPVSSSGHLVLVQSAMGISDIPLFFDAVLHIGTLASVAVVMANEIIALFAHPIKNHFVILLVATIPAAVVGYVLNDVIEAAFSGVILGICFIATAAILLLSELIANTLDSRKDIGWKSGLAMGGMQALALFPGISRSGSTIAGGLYCGADRTKAASFAFLMSVPVILGSVMLEGFEISQVGIGDLSAEVILAGIIAAAASGFAAIKLMFKLIKSKKLYGFSVYAAALGAFVLIDQGALHLIF